MDYIYILGVKLHKIKEVDILKKVKEWLAGDKFHYITTVNPEFILEAQKDKEFKEILNNADLSIPDGTGLKFAAWVFGRNIYRVAGSDLAKEILAMEGKKYFFIWKNGLSGVDEVKDKLEYPSAKVGRDAINRVSTTDKFQDDECDIDGQAIERDGSDIDWEKFNDFAPDILLVGLGAPYQERLIAKIKLRENQSSDALGKIPPNPPLQKGELGIKLAVGIGGTFDFLTGKTKRAPKLMRILGLEWLYRMCQPAKPPHNYFYRVKRVFTAVFIFPLEVIKWRMRMIFCYRKGVLAVIISRENKILLCERADEKDHWQFPQGGIEQYENMEQCLEREIYEEVGLRNIKIIKHLDNRHKYRFKIFRDLQEYGFAGQIKDVFIARFLGNDDEVKLDNREFIKYQWVAVDELLEKLHPVRREVGEIIFRELENLLGIKN